MADLPAEAPRPGRLRGARAGASGTVAFRDAERGEGERGAVTAEYAVLLPAAVAVLVAVLLAGVAAVHQVRAQDAAASAARILARGDAESLARDAVGRMAGGDAALEARTAEGWVTVTVTRPGPGPLAAATLSAEAVAPVQATSPTPPGRTPGIPAPTGEAAP